MRGLWGGSFGRSAFARMGCDVATNARPAGGPPRRLGAAASSCRLSAKERQHDSRAAASSGNERGKGPGVAWCVISPILRGFAAAKALRGHGARPPSLRKLALPIQNRPSVGLKRLAIRLLLVESLTLNDQDLERLLNRPDGETRLPSTTGGSFPLSHEVPPANSYCPTGRKVGLCAAGIPMLRCRIDPSREGVLRASSESESSSSSPDSKRGTVFP